jgi:hypothetical protein
VPDSNVMNFGECHHSNNMDFYGNYVYILCDKFINSSYKYTHFRLISAHMSDVFLYFPTKYILTWVQSLKTSFPRYSKD